MSEVKELVRMIALDRAYQMASTEGESACRECGMPASRYAQWGHFFPYCVCHRCQPTSDKTSGYSVEFREYSTAKAIIRLTRIAKGEAFG